eukprot:scaffold8114_cov20-Tisochrysis_lutea.AAC.1
MDAELSALLSRLGLGRLEETLVEEAITELPLLASMGADMLYENLSEIGVDKEAIAILSAELFPRPPPPPQVAEAVADATSVAIASDCVGGKGSAVTPAAGTNGSAGRAEVEGMTHEEEAAHEMAEWLLKPYLGNQYLEDGQYANAAATYTQALALEAPNPRANAALYYNRSCAHHRLGRLWLALRDATLAAEADPRRSARAWWRVADVALATGDIETAKEAVAKGLTAQPGCAPLKKIQATIAADIAGI